MNTSPDERHDPAIWPINEGRTEPGRATSGLPGMTTDDHDDGPSRQGHHVPTATEHDHGGPEE
jgi:hypothetical protein